MNRALCQRKVIYEYNTLDDSGKMLPINHVCFFTFFLQCVKALVYSDQGSGLLDLDALNDFGDTAVHLAAKWGYSKCSNVHRPLILYMTDIYTRHHRSLLPMQDASSLRQKPHSSSGDFVVAIHVVRNE